MKYGARLLDSPIPPRIPFTRAVAPSSLVTDWTTVPPDGDPIGNDYYGCCVPAAIYRWAQIALARRYNRVDPIDRADVLDLYARDTSFVIATGANDNGTDPNTAMTNWAAAKVPLIFAQETWPILWARCKVDPAEVAEAMSQTPLLMTVWLPSADADHPENWGNAPGTGKGWEGTEGHEMLLVRNGTDGWTVRSWGLDWPWHLGRLQYVHDLAVPVEAAHTDLTRLGLDFEALRAA